MKRNSSSSIIPEDEALANEEIMISLSEPLLSQSLEVRTTPSRFCW